MQMYLLLWIFSCTLESFRFLQDRWLHSTHVPLEALSFALLSQLLLHHTTPSPTAALPTKQVTVFLYNWNSSPTSLPPNTHSSPCQNRRKTSPFWSPIPLFGVALPQPRRSVQGFAIVNILSSHIAASSGVGTIKFSIWSNWNIPSSAAAFIATITAVTSILSIATRFFDSAVHRGCSQPKIHHPEGVLFLLVDRVGRFAVVRRHPPILNPHRHRTSTPRC